MTGSNKNIEIFSFEGYTMSVFERTKPSRMWLQICKFKLQLFLAIDFNLINQKWCIAVSCATSVHKYHEPFLGTCGKIR